MVLGMKARKQKLTVKRISREETKNFILEIHYARRMPCVQYAFGLFDGDYPFPVGVVTYGQPASAPLCKGVAGEENRKHVLELNRLVLYPEYNGDNSLFRMQTGGGGIMSGMCIRQRTFCIRDSRKQERTSIPNRDTRDTISRTKHAANGGQKSIGIYTSSATRNNAPA